MSWPGVDILLVDIEQILSRYHYTSPLTATTRARATTSGPPRTWPWRTTRGRWRRSSPRPSHGNSSSSSSCSSVSSCQDTRRQKLPQNRCFSAAGVSLLLHHHRDGAALLLRRAYRPEGRAFCSDVNVSFKLSYRSCNIIQICYIYFKPYPIIRMTPSLFLMFCQINML